jgi:hypothetical protein
LTGILNTTEIAALTAEQLFALDVGECPIGTYSTGGNVGSLCTTCASDTGGATGGLGPYSTTLETGSANVTDCNGALPYYRWRWRGASALPLPGLLIDPFFTCCITHQWTSVVLCTIPTVSFPNKAHLRYISIVAKLD